MSPDTMTKQSPPIGHNSGVDPLATTQEDGELQGVGFVAAVNEDVAQSFDAGRFLEATRLAAAVVNGGAVPKSAILSPAQVGALPAWKRFKTIAAAKSFAHLSVSRSDKLGRQSAAYALIEFVGNHSDNQYGRAQEYVSRICKVTGCSLSSIKRAIKDLVDAGILCRLEAEDGSKLASFYWLRYVDGMTDTSPRAVSEELSPRANHRLGRPRGEFFDEEPQHPEINEKKTWPAYEPSFAKHSPQVSHVSDDDGKKHGPNSKKTWPAYEPPNNYSFSLTKLDRTEQVEGQAETPPTCPDTDHSSLNDFERDLVARFQSFGLPDETIAELVRLEVFQPDDRTIPGVDHFCEVLQALPPDDVARISYEVHDSWTCKAFDYGMVENSEMLDLMRRLLDGSEPLDDDLEIPEPKTAWSYRCDLIAMGTTEHLADSVMDHVRANDGGIFSSDELNLTFGCLVQAVEAGAKSQGKDWVRRLEVQHVNSWIKSLQANVAQDWTATLIAQVPGFPLSTDEPLPF